MSNLSSQDLKDLLKVNRTSLECRQVNELQEIGTSPGAGSV